MTSRDAIKKLEAAGWELVRISKSSHHQFKHPDFSYRVTVPYPKRELSKGVENQVLKAAGLK